MQHMMDASEPHNPRYARIVRESSQRFPFDAVLIGSGIIEGLIYQGGMAEVACEVYSTAGQIGTQPRWRNYTAD
ncbi:UNVERIFIED_CONTAM: hypothetical protein FKN15_078018 [Acipenser sinensis]